jgi:hypothetical protein
MGISHVYPGTMEVTYISDIYKTSWNIFFFKINLILFEYLAV